MYPRRVTTVMSATLLLALSAACGDDDDDGVADAAAMVPDGAVAAPDASLDQPDGMTAMPDAAGPVNAASLGQVCNPGACPTGYTCLAIVAGEPGFCSIPCGGSTDMTTCADGFPGPGEGGCIFAATIMGMPTPFCGVKCGAQWSLPNDCPTGLMCEDRTGPAGMPDGMNDACLP